MHARVWLLVSLAALACAVCLHADAAATRSQNRLSAAAATKTMASSKASTTFVSAQRSNNRKSKQKQKPLFQPPSHHPPSWAIGGMQLQKKYLAAMAASEAPEPPAFPPPSTTPTCFLKRPTVTQSIPLEGLKRIVIDNQLSDEKMLDVRKVDGDRVKFEVRWITASDRLDVVSLTKMKLNIDNGVFYLNITAPTPDMPGATADPGTAPAPKQDIPDDARTKRKGLLLTIRMNITSNLIANNVTYFAQKAKKELCDALGAEDARIHFVSFEKDNLNADRVIVKFSVADEPDPEKAKTSKSKEAVFASLLAQVDNPLSPLRQNGVFFPYVVGKQEPQAAATDLYECDDGTMRVTCAAKVTTSAAPGSRSPAWSIIALTVAIGITSSFFSSGGKRDTRTSIMVVALLCLVLLTHAAVDCPKAHVTVSIGKSACFTVTREPGTSRFFIDFLKCNGPVIESDRCIVGGFVDPQCRPMRTQIPSSRMGITFAYRVLTSSSEIKKVEYSYVSKACSSANQPSDCPPFTWRPTSNNECEDDCWVPGALAPNTEYSFKLRLTGADGNSREVQCFAKHNRGGAVDSYDQWFVNDYQPKPAAPPQSGQIFNGHAELPIERNATKINDKVQFRFMPFSDTTCGANLKHQYAIGTKRCASDILDWTEHEVVSSPQVVTSPNVKLADGEYFISLRATNAFSTATVCHSPFVVDTMPPLFAEDGTGVVAACDQSEPTAPVIENRWQPKAISGISHVEWGYGPSDPAVGAVYKPLSTRDFNRDFVSGTGPLRFPASLLNMLNETLYLKLRVWSNAGLPSALQTSRSAVTMSLNPPRGGQVSTTPVYINDGLQLDDDPNVRSAAVEVHWSGFEGDIGYFLVGLGNIEMTDNVKKFTKVTNTTTKLNINAKLKSGAPLFATVTAGGMACRPYGGAQQVVSSGRILVDFSPPTVDSVFDGTQLGVQVSTITDVTTQVGVSWRAVDPETGIKTIKVALGTANNAEEIAPFVDVAQPVDGVMSYRFLSLSQLNKLQKGVTYMATVRVTNGVKLTTEKRSAGFTLA